jgi:hypothetical protein
MHRVGNEEKPHTPGGKALPTTPALVPLAGTPASAPEAPSCLSSGARFSTSTGTRRALNNFSALGPLNWAVKDKKRQKTAWYPNKTTSNVSVTLALSLQQPRPITTTNPVRLHPLNIPQNSRCPSRQNAHPRHLGAWPPLGLPARRHRHRHRQAQRAPASSPHFLALGFLTVPAPPEPNSGVPNPLLPPNGADAAGFRVPNRPLGAGAWGDAAAPKGEAPMLNPPADTRKQESKTSQCCRVGWDGNPVQRSSMARLPIVDRNEKECSR